MQTSDKAGSAGENISSNRQAYSLRLKVGRQRNASIKISKSKQQEMQANLSIMDRKTLGTMTGAESQ